MLETDTKNKMCGYYVFQDRLVESTLWNLQGVYLKRAYQTSVDFYKL